MRLVRTAFLLASPVLACAYAALADNPGSRLQEVPVRPEQVHRLRVTTGGHVIENTMAQSAGSSDLRGGCQQISSHTDANFGGGSYIVQAGFAETEIAAATYTLPASAFPIRIDLMEMIFATQGTNQQTTTQWSVLVWDGPPNTGILVAEFSSDGVILPHIVLPPGAPAGVNVQVAVDPGDPEQIFITDQSGTHSFTVGYRVDEHHVQNGDGCSQAPPATANAFPATDTSGLLRPTDNWLRGVNCGPFGCPANGGWARFSQLNAFCRPSGDWVMRATWSPLNCAPGVGACCLPSGACEVLLDSDCATAQGLYQGDGTTCTGQQCPQPTGACCFQGTGGCINLTSGDCQLAGGVYGGNGTSCGTFVCFPQGACCLPTGACIGPVTPSDCQSQGGTFQGNNSSCGTVTCPLPQGACCFSSGGCLNFTQANCETADGVWHGAGTSCTQPNICFSQCGLCGDSNCDNNVSVSDIGYFVTAVAQGQAAWEALAGTDCDFLCANDTNNDNQVTVSDIGAFVARMSSGVLCD